MNNEGQTQSTHPGLEELLTKVLAEENAQAGDYNREVLKEWNEDKLKFEQ